MDQNTINDLLKKVKQGNLTTTVASTGQTESQYPRRPHRTLVGAKTTTDLDVLHQMMELDIEDLNGSQSTIDDITTARSQLEDKYLFTASTENKWSKFFFNRWKDNVIHVVLEHVSKIATIERSRAILGEGGRRLLQPSLRNVADIGPHADPSNTAGKFCADLVWKHPLIINEDTFNQDLEEWSRDINPVNHSNLTSQSRALKQEAETAITAFKDNTRVQLRRLQGIVSHEVERLILKIMPKGENTQIFQSLLHERIKYIEAEQDRQAATIGNDLNAPTAQYQPVPYNAQQTFDYLERCCTGSNERMSIVYSYSLINHERQSDQGILAWSRSFKQMLREKAKFDPLPDDPDKKEVHHRTYYHDPFVGQLTAKELSLLSAGGFLQDTSVIFDVDKLEQFVAGRASTFPTNKFRPDQRTRDFIQSKKAAFSSVAPKTGRSSNGKKRRSNDSHDKHTLYADSHTRSSKQRKSHKITKSQDTRRDSFAYQYTGNKGKSKGKGKGKAKGKGKGKGKVSKGKNYGRGHHSSQYGDRQGPRSSDDRWRDKNNPQNSSYRGNRKQNAPSTSPTSYSGPAPWCHFCNRSGHQTRFCWKRQKVTRSRLYKDVMIAAEDSTKPHLEKVMNAIGNPYCQTCCDPMCPVSIEQDNPDIECPHGESEGISAAKTILLTDHTPLADFIAEQKPSQCEPSSVYYTETGEWNDDQWEQHDSEWWGGYGKYHQEEGVYYAEHDGEESDHQDEDHSHPPNVGDGYNIHDTQQSDDSDE